MCGLAGLVLGKRRRSRKEREQLEDMFTRMLLLSEHRGPHATGVAWVKRDGSHRVEKGPFPARTFTLSSQYIDLLNGMDDQVTVLMGHTRWPTRGSERNNRNNHPLIVETDIERGSVLLTHNGHIQGVEQLFRRWRLPRCAEVDSELLVQLAYRHLTPSGIDAGLMLRDLAQVEGKMSSVIVATNSPERVFLLKGNMPLEVRYHPKRKIIAYASEPTILERALPEYGGWEDVPLRAGMMLTIDTGDMNDVTVSPFALRGMMLATENTISNPKCTNT
jgi:glucosamine 6-phosphate synthetase-like amidotransferase/phosphosugar isomerase protein